MRGGIRMPLPDKLYFKIGEVSKIAGVPPYVLRFWENAFKKIRPKRTPSGQRLYRKKDVELILTIKHLLYDKQFTIRGANRYLNALAKEERVERIVPSTLDAIKAELRDILMILKKDPSSGP
jgi:DNA-binding transcriptional MerR regulator